MNYFPLRTVVKTAGGQILSTEETISDEVGEPNPALFALPPGDYVESKDRKEFVERAVRNHGFGPQSGFRKPLLRRRRGRTPSGRGRVDRTLPFAKG